MYYVVVDNINAVNKFSVALQQLHFQQLHFFSSELNLLIKTLNNQCRRTCG